MKNYLPLGSIVRLKGSNKKLMIYGRAQTAGEPKKLYDCLACLYPQGHFKSNMLLCFNEEQIEEVIFTGYTDEEERPYVEKLGALIDGLREAEAKKAEALIQKPGEESDQTK